MITLHERIASSLPGIGNVTGSGSTFVSTSAMIGIRRRSASRTPIASVLRSTKKIASGGRCRFRTPPRFAVSFSRSDSDLMRSRVGSSSSVPSSTQLFRSCSRLIRFEIVWKLVSRPPSQRWSMYGMPAFRPRPCTRPGLVGVPHCFLFGGVLDRVAGLLLRADEHDRAAPRGDVGRELLRLLEQTVGLLQVDDVDAGALAEDEATHLRVPAARLVAEVNAGLQQLLDAYLGH